VFRGNEIGCLLKGDRLQSNANVNVVTVPLDLTVTVADCPTVDRKSHTNTHARVGPLWARAKLLVIASSLLLFIQLRQNTVQPLGGQAIVLLAWSEAPNNGWNDEAHNRTLSPRWLQVSSVKT
jgi:hypothetical protein